MILCPRRRDEREGHDDGRDLGGRSEPRPAGGDDIAVIDHGSFTAAADVLQISQPSLSRRIHALEATLGFRLFLPVGRRREITEEGRGVVSAARRTLAELASIDAMARSARALTTGTLRVTGLPSLVATAVAAHLGRFHRAHPGVRVEVIHGR